MIWVWLLFDDGPCAVRKLVPPSLERLSCTWYPWLRRLNRTSDLSKTRRYPYIPPFWAPLNSCLWRQVLVLHIRWSSSKSSHTQMIWSDRTQDSP